MVRQKLFGIFMLVILLASSFGTLALDFGNRIPNLGNTNDLGNIDNNLRNINNHFENLNDFEFRFRDITTDEELERIYNKLSSQAAVLKSEIDYLIVVSNQAMTSDNKERVTKLFTELSEKTDELRKLIITVGKLKNKAQESNNKLMLAKSDLLLNQLRGYQLKMANVVVSLNKYYLETRTGSGNGDNNWNAIDYAERLTDFMIIIKDLSNTNTEVNYEKELQDAYCAGNSERQAELIFELSLSKIVTKGIKTVAEQYAADLDRLEKYELIAIQFKSLAGKAGKLFDIYDALLAFKPDSRACSVTDPISDADKDGIANGVDNCISTPNPNQADTDKDSIGDACDMVNNSNNNNQTDQNTVKTFQERFDEIEKKLKEDNGYKDDFDYFEGKYLEAKEDDDKDDLEKYEDKLSDLDDDLDNLLDDLKDLEDEVEEKNKKDNLLEDIADLQEDMENLRKEIDELLNSKKTQTTASTVTATAPQNNNAVVWESLDLASLSRVGVRDTLTVQEESFNQWKEIKPYAWLGAGLVIVFAIIIFLAALLLL